MQRLNTMTPLTIDDGTQSKKMVLYVRRNTNTEIIVKIDSRIVPTPVKIDPVRRGKPQQLANGPAILSQRSPLSVSGNREMKEKLGFEHLKASETLGNFTEKIHRANSGRKTIAFRSL